MTDDLVPAGSSDLASEEGDLLRKELTNVRDEMRGNTYIEEAIRVLPVRGYRSAIGSYWNAVVDDLRQKVMHRSLDMFNKEINTRREVKTYEDFQDLVGDFDLIEGAYKIGVIGWEARKLLHHAREVRHIFDGHPSSSEPSLIKVLGMISDCNRYVLSEDFPPSIINIDEYIQTLDSPSYDRNKLAVEQAVVDLPPIYKRELINRLYDGYSDPASSTDLRANIEFCGPVLWRVLPKDDRQQVARRFDKDMAAGNRQKIDAGVDFLSRVQALAYISTASREAIFGPAVERLEQALDDWAREAKAVRYLSRLGMTIPDGLLDRYVRSLALTFVGRKGSSPRFPRTDFYSDAAAPYIPDLFARFDDRAAEAFVSQVRTSELLQHRIAHPGQLARLRALANILLNREGLRDDITDFLDLLTDRRTDRGLL